MLLMFSAPLSGGEQGQQHLQSKHPDNSRFRVMQGDVTQFMRQNPCHLIRAAGAFYQAMAEHHPPAGQRKGIDQLCLVGFANIKHPQGESRWIVDTPIQCVWQSC